MKRYRNSHEIQTLVKFINSEFSDNCQNFEEKLAPPLSISSSLPIWIDVGDEHHLLSSAIETIKKLHSQKSSDQSKGYLLFDNFLDGDIQTEMISYWDSDTETCLEWMQFIGCEADNIVWVTAGASPYGHEGGHVLESISRAKMNLAIITIKTKGFGEDYRELTEILW